MSSSRRVRFVAAIRLVPNTDSIGVPIFTAVRGNEMFVPEMDGDLRVADFMEFYNEHNYTIAYDIPAGFYNKVYTIGSTTPIPFWLSSACHVIHGDSDKDEPVKLFGPLALRNPVLADISRLLDDARSGRISERMQEWTAANIANSFADVFHEVPSRSRYWVSRYRVALAKARRMTKPPHPIDSRLRQVAGDWLQRFGSKTDLSKVGGLLGSSAYQIFSRRQISDILFAFLIGKVAQNDAKDIEAYLQEPTLHKAFPRGLHGYFIDNGWPRVPFYYEKFGDFIPHLMDVLSRCHEDEEYWPAAKLALLYYGRASLPNQIGSIAKMYFEEIRKEFSHAKRYGDNIFNDRKRSYAWVPCAEAIWGYYVNMMDLDGIMNGQFRMKREPYDKRFGLSINYIDDLKKIMKRKW